MVLDVTRLTSRRVVCFGLLDLSSVVSKVSSVMVLVYSSMFYWPRVVPARLWSHMVLVMNIITSRVNNPYFEPSLG